MPPADERVRGMPGLSEPRCQCTEANQGIAYVPDSNFASLCYLLCRESMKSSNAHDEVIQLGRHGEQGQKVSLAGLNLWP